MISFCVVSLCQTEAQQLIKGLMAALLLLFPQDPKDYYLVGNRVQYACITGYYLSGSAVAQCTGNQGWTKEPRVCRGKYCILFYHSFIIY